MCSAPHGISAEAAARSGNRGGWSHQGRSAGGDSPACGQEILPVGTALNAAHTHGMSAEGRDSNSRRAPSLNFESTLFHQGLSGEVSSKFQSSDPPKQSSLYTVQQPSQGQNFYSHHLSAQVFSNNICPIKCCSKALRIPAEQLHS